MPGIKEALDSLLGDSTDFAKTELVDLVKTAKSDERELIKDLGKMSEEFIEMLASGELTPDEFREVMVNLVDLNEMQLRKLSSTAKVRAEETAGALKNLIIDGLLALF